MFKIFKLELKRIMKSPLFFIVVILITLFTISQIGLNVDVDKVKKPIEGQESYGTYQSSDMEIIKPRALDRLISEYTENSYTTYPYGFYKKVRLSDEENDQVGKTISALTGKPLEWIKNKSDKSSGEEVNSIEVKKELTDKDFIDLMNVADTIIGTGSHYGKEYLVGTFGQAEKDYKMALEEYKLIIEKDKISGAYARYFSDYLGIALAIAPVFLSVGVWYLDKFSRSQDILYVRKVKSRDIVLGRYLAMVISIFILIFAIATYYNINVISRFGIENIDVLAYYKYTIIWLVPTMLIPLAAGTLLTIITDSPVGIIVQLVWWFLDTSAKFESIKGGGYGTSLILRHNTVGNTLSYMNNVNQIIVNRIVYVIVALVMVVLAEKVYDKKRVGKLGGVNVIKKVR